MIKKVLNRNQIMGIRTTNDFVSKFDMLCVRLGYCRSEVVRYALKQFLSANWNNSENFKNSREGMF